MWCAFLSLITQLQRGRVAVFVAGWGVLAVGLLPVSANEGPLFDETVSFIEQGLTSCRGISNIVVRGNFLSFTSDDEPPPRNDLFMGNSQSE
jgi:hypothetical protein